MPSSRGRNLAAMSWKNASGYLTKREKRRSSPNCSLLHASIVWCRIPMQTTSSSPHYSSARSPPPPPPHIILINHHLWLWLWLRLHLSSFFCHFWLNFQGQLRASLADAIRSRSALRSNPYCKGIFNLLKKWRPFFPIFTGDASVRSISRWWTSDPFYHARPGIWRQVCDADSVQILRRDEKKNLDCVCRAV